MVEGASEEDERRHRDTDAEWEQSFRDADEWYESRRDDG